MPQTFLIFLFGDLGDTILTVPAVRALRRRYPAARLLALGKPASLSFVSKLGLVDGSIAVDKHLFDRPTSLFSFHAWRGIVALFMRLRRERIQTVVIFHHLVSRWGTAKYALLALATGARERVGIDNGRGWFLTRSVRDEGFGGRHEAEYWLDVAACLDAPGSLELEAPVSAENRETAACLLKKHGANNERLVAIHAGVGWYGPGRRWQAVNFARAAQLILQRVSARCVLVGTEQDADASDKVLRYLGDQALSLVGLTDIGELAAVLERCDVLVANDSGVAHLAAAVGTPVVAVFGPSNDRAWRPPGSKVLAAELPCRPCFYRDFTTGNPQGCATRECLDLVTPAQVARAALDLLGAGVVDGER